MGERGRDLATVRTPSGEHKDPDGDGGGRNFWKEEVQELGVCRGRVSDAEPRSFADQRGFSPSGAVWRGRGRHP